MQYYLSTAMAASVLTEAQTDTPWRYGVALHINQPNSHSEMDVYSSKHVISKMPLIYLSIFAQTNTAHND